MADDGLRERLWDSHATAGSVWGLFASFPVLVLGLYWRDRRLLAATLGFVALNPVLFEPAAETRPEQLVSSWVSGSGSTKGSARRPPTPRSWRFVRP